MLLMAIARQKKNYPLGGRDANRRIKANADADVNTNEASSSCGSFRCLSGTSTTTATATATPSIILTPGGVRLLICPMVIPTANRAGRRVPVARGEILPSACPMTQVQAAAAEGEEEQWRAKQRYGVIIPSITSIAPNYSPIGSSRIYE